MPNSRLTVCVLYFFFSGGSGFALLALLSEKEKWEGEKVTHASHKDERKWHTVKELFLLLIHFYPLHCR